MTSPAAQAQSAPLLTLSNGALAVSVSPHGAEPRSLTDAAGREYLWQAGDPWNRSACHLFPAICRHVDDALIHRGERFPMPKHGLDRDLGFAVLADGTDPERPELRFALDSSERTRAAFPFDFRLEIAYRIAGTALTIEYTVANRSEEPMPFALGWHPAFAWPLPQTAEAVSSPSPSSPAAGSSGAAAEAHASARAAAPAHVLEWASGTAPASFRRLDDDLLLPDAHPSASLGAEGSAVPLDPAHFAPGAALFDGVGETSVVFRAADGSGPRVAISWEGFENLTLWQAPGCDFLCIEPWAGLPASVGDAREETSRSDLRLLGPGETSVHRITVDITG